MSRWGFINDPDTGFVRLCDSAGIYYVYVAEMVQASWKVTERRYSWG